MSLTWVLWGFFYIIEIQLIVDPWLLESVDVEGQCGTVTLYIRDLSIQGFWYPWEGPGTNFLQILRSDCIYYIVLCLMDSLLVKSSPKSSYKT